MPIKRVQFPDGTIHRIEVPEGATNEQIISFVQAQHPEAKKPANRNPLATMGDALQHHGMNAVHGVAQLVEHGANAAANLLPDGNPVRGYVNKTVAADDAALAKREADYQARTPDGVPAAIGAGIGEIAPWMVGVGELRAAGMLPKIAGTGKAAIAKKGLALSAEGAAMGASQPVTDGSPYAAEKARQIGVGAVAAPVTAGVLKGTGAAASGVRTAARYATPTGRQTIAASRLGKLLADAKADPNALRTPAKVPGYVPSIDQASPSAELVSLTRGLRNDKNGAGLAFANQDAANNAALHQQIQGVAGQDGAIEAAVKARRAATQPFRDKHLPETGSKLVDASGVVSALEQRVNSANATVSAAAREHLRMIRRQMVDGKAPAYLLDDIRQEAGGMLAKHATNGAVGSKVSAKYEPVRSAITDALDGAIPGYRDYLASYSRLSAPINDMEAGRTLLSAVDSAGRDVNGNQNVDLAKVRQLLAKDNKAQYPMTPAARGKLSDLLDTLQQRTVSQNKIAAAGPGTAADMADTAQRGLLRLLSHGTMIGGGALTHGATGAAGGLMLALGAEGKRIAETDIRRRIGEIAAKSPEAASALEAYLNKGTKPADKYLRLLLPYEQRAIAGGR